MDFLKKVFDQARTLWVGMSLPARLGLAAAAAAVVLTVWTTTTTQGGDPWKVVAGFDTPREDRAKIHDLLKSKTYELDEAAYNRDGVVKVKEEREGAARLELVAAGIATDQDIFKWLETPDFSRTSSTEMKLWYRSVQRKIELMLTGFGSIDHASVQIVPQSERAAFINSGPEATASVVCRLKTGKEFSTNEARAIGKVLQGSVMGLKPENIFITEAGTGRYFPVPKEDNAYWTAFNISESERQKAEDLREKIASHLRGLFGNQFSLSVVYGMNPATRNSAASKKSVGDNNNPTTHTLKETENNQTLGYLPGADQLSKGLTLPEAAVKSDRKTDEKDSKPFEDVENVTEETPAGTRIGYLNVVATINVDESKLGPDQATIDKKKKEIKDAIEAMTNLGTGSTNLGADGKPVAVAKVSVAYIAAIIAPPEIPVATTASQLWDFAKQYAGTALLVALSIAALIIVHRLVRVALERRGIKELEDATKKAEEETPEFLEWEAAEAAVQRAKLQVKEMVQRNPRAVATVLKRWMAIPK